MSGPVERPRAGAAAGSGTIRARASDFAVDEQIDMDPADAGGEHLWLRVRKCGENTDRVASVLARVAGIRVRDVGYAGRKDRHAVTTQWFSLHLPGRPDPDLSELADSIRVLEACRRRRKLVTGGLRANRFRIVVREFSGNPDLLAARVAELAAQGLPNYFGAQRFGRAGANLPLAHDWLGGTRRIADRRLRGLLLSTARAAIFNAVLAERVRDGSWNAPCLGDTLMHDRRGSFFIVHEIDAALQARVRAGELHPAGPLWGAGESQAGGEIAQLEQATAQRFAALASGLARMGLRQERRALRMMPRTLHLEWLDTDCLALEFDLPAGSYATVLLDELLECRDATASD